jgi:hypothetical protein
MALPKAILCVLGARTAGDAQEEVLLLAAGFATATIYWDEVTAVQRGWMQLQPVLDDPAVHAWVFVGQPENITSDLLSQISMLTLSLARPAPPMTALVLSGGGEEPALSDLLGHIRIFRGNVSFAARLAAARLKPRTALPRPFHVVAHVDPLVGQWLEVGPRQGETWDGFMIGVTGAEVTAFGVGPRGAVPLKSTLHYPQCGIRGEWGRREFSACAARNVLDIGSACFLRVEGAPAAFFVAGYPEETPSDAEPPVQVLDLF